MEYRILISIVNISTNLKDIDINIDKKVLKNIDIDNELSKNIAIVIDKEVLKNIDIDTVIK